MVSQQQSNPKASALASEALKRTYDYFKDYDWKDWQPKDLTPHMPFLKTVWEFQKMKGNDEKAYHKPLLRHLAQLELHFGEGQSGALPYMKQAMGFWHGGPVLGRTGQQMRATAVEAEDVTHPPPGLERRRDGGRPKSARPPPVLSLSPPL